MYDIEGKLRRRAMLERLEGLGRASEGRSNAVAIPVPDQSPGPRHRNDHVAEVPVADVLSPLHDDLSLRVGSPEPDQTDLDAALDEAPDLAAAGPYQLVAAPYAEASPYVVEAGPYAEASPYVVEAGPYVEASPYVVDGVHDPELEPLEPAPPIPASSAATIADLLRHGSGRLFFQPDRPPAAPPPPAPAAQD
jgi:hypothetical protein